MNKNLYKKWKNYVSSIFLQPGPGFSVPGKGGWGGGFGACREPWAG